MPDLLPRFFPPIVFSDETSHTSLLAGVLRDTFEGEVSMDKVPMRWVRAVPALFTVITAAILASGCMPKGSRFYSGDVKPAREVALIVYADGTTMITHDGGLVLAAAAESAGHPVNLSGGAMAAVGSVLEALPGHYSLSAGYVGSSSIGPPVEFSYVLEAGQIYVLYSTFDNNGEQWKPVLVDVVEYSKASCEASRTHGCPDPAEIRKKADDYLRGERRVVK